MKMTQRKELDLTHLTIIEEGDVPAKAVRYTPYRALLKRIRRGKALVLSDAEVNTNTIRAGIKRLQKKGEFQKIIMRQMTGKDGIKKLYVINPSEEPTLQ